ncbi:MAG: fasciclin domain-containing protein [Actinomycetota bacterium]|jgi:uncharacterized surface protein with fasciclin (FAS1) repeats|nr:fasciclin domain-containing protein [Actinomycetota bacterium]
MNTRAVTLAASLLIGGVGATACSSSTSSAPTTTMATTNTMQQTTTKGSKAASENIVQLAESNPDLSTLVTAIKAAGLVQTLEGPGPFTVFAPTNQAFAALPAGTLQTLLQPANKAELAAILTYHVVAGAYTSSNLPTGTVKTVNGATVTVGASGGSVHITDGKGGTVQVTQANIAASNGVIHVINGVLLPPAS